MFPYLLPTRPSFDQIESDAITKDTKEWQSCRHASRRLSAETWQVDVWCASQSSPCSIGFGELSPSLTPMKRNDGICSLLFFSFLPSFSFLFSIPLPFYFRVSCGIRNGRKVLLLSVWIRLGRVPLFFAGCVVVVFWSGRTTMSLSAWGE